MLHNGYNNTINNLNEVIIMEMLIWAIGSLATCKIGEVIANVLNML